MLVHVCDGLLLCEMCHEMGCSSKQKVGATSVFLPYALKTFTLNNTDEPKSQ